MSKPSIQAVHTNRPLTNLAIGWFGDHMGVSERMFPIIPVEKQSDTYYEYSLADLTRIEAAEVAPGGVAPSAGFDVDSSASYFCKNQKLRFAILDETRDNADEPLQLETAGILYLGMNHRKRQEKLFATNAFVAASWTNTKDGATAAFIQWDLASSDPIQNIEDWRDEVLVSTGFLPNKITFGVDAWRSFKNHATVLDRIKHTQRGIVTEELAAALLGLDEVMVAREMETTSVEGAATRTSAFICDTESVLLAYVTESPSIWIPSAGYNFAWKGLARNNEGIAVKTYRVEERSSDFIEQHTARDPKVVATDLGIFAFDVLS